MNRKKCKISVFLLFVFAPLLFAEKTGVENLFRFKLENGLELFAVEDNNVPLVYIEIAVRAGAVTQDKKTAGLFHLYEHMMFKGNSKFKNQKEVTDALNQMGVSNWNGTTGVDRVNYYFTIPASLAREGLEFWSYAIREPLFDETEFANEKLVVISEIAAHKTTPSRIVGAGLNKKLFPECPWRVDTAGSPQIIESATVNQLKEIQKRFYVPQNSALFVGGDIKADEVFELVKQIYGDWEPGKDESALKVNVPSKDPFESDKKFVYADPRLTGAFAQAEYYLRGPDGETDAADTYGADVWDYLLSNPQSSYIKNMINDKSLSIPDSDYASGFYSTMRASGLIGFSAMFLNDGETDEESVLLKAERLLDLWKNKSVEDMLSEGTGFSAEDIAAVKKRLEISRVFSSESAKGLLSQISSAWSSCGADYYFSYDENILKVTKQDVNRFVEKYIQGKNGAFVLSVNPQYYEARKDLFDEAGYEQINSENAFWWSDEEKNSEQESERSEQ